MSACLSLYRLDMVRNDFHDQVVWPMLLRPSIPGLHSRWHSFEPSMATPCHLISGDMELWKKSMMRDCLCIPQTNIRVHSQCLFKFKQDLAKGPPSSFVNDGRVYFDGSILLFDVLFNTYTQNVPLFQSPFT